MLAMDSASSQRPASSNTKPPSQRPGRKRAVADTRRRIYFDVATLARVLGWSPKRTLRWLKREKAAVRHGRHYFTTRGLLRRAFPDTWDEVLAGVTEDDSGEDQD